MENYDLIQKMPDTVIHKMYAALKKHGVAFLCPECAGTDYEENLGSLIDGYQIVRCKCGWSGRKMDMSFDRTQL